MRKYGKWDIVKPLGEGGQGQAFLAVDTDRLDLASIKQTITSVRLKTIASTPDEFDNSAADLAQAVLNYGKRESPEYCGALKILHSSQEPGAVKKQLDRMNAEVEALRSTSHPSIIPILDGNLDENWFVMKYFSEGTLADHLARHRGKFVDALRAFRPLVEGVAELHRLKLVHRDIKPENVFSSAGNLVLGDLGLVFFLDQARSRISDTFENVGSRDWMPGWAMGMRIDDIRPSFDVFSLGKLLWSMVSGQPRLQLWYHHRDRFELEKMFPDSPDIRWARLILDKCIVENEVDCLPDASRLLDIVDKVLNAVERHSQVVSENVRRICNVCGLGEYVEMSKDALALAQTFRIFRCNHCGHTEWFYAASGTPGSWKPGAILPATTKVEQSDQTLPTPAELRERLQTVDLSIKLVSGHAQNFAIEVTNHSDLQVAITRIRVESRSVEITQPAEPAQKEQWILQPRSKLPIGWSASPDPAVSLTRKNSNAGIRFEDEVDFILQIEMSGVRRRVTKRMIVQVDVSNRVISQLVG